MLVEVKGCLLGEVKCCLEVKGCLMEEVNGYMLGAFVDYLLSEKEGYVIGVV